MSRYYLTTPLYYVNSKPHIGHSYTEIAADVLSRYHRLAGHEVLFLTGTDEHGQKIEKAAREAGMEPQAFTDKISATFRELWTTLDIDHFEFIRTTEKRHVLAVQEVWRRLEKSGDIYKSAYVGWYCTPDESFWTDAQILQEEGKKLCPDCRRPVEKIEEENFFFKISKYQAWLTKTIRDGGMKILPETRRNEVLGFIDNNVLQDLCISRPKARLSWGIESPLSKEHVTYVWFDALINYISAVGFGADQAKLETWWPADVHLIGKDILRHHAIYWPILLHALGLRVPKLIFAHGWWMQGGDKMSKSRGNVTDPVQLVHTYGVDGYRYFLLTETPFGQDGTFSEEALIKRINTALANDLGNLLHRSLTMCEKYFAGEVPGFDFDQRCSDMAKNSEKIAAEARHLEQLSTSLPGLVAKALERLAFSEALDAVWSLISAANQFIEASAPWTLAKQGKKDELELVIRTLMEVLRAVAYHAWPVIPTKAAGIWEQLGLAEKIPSIPIKDLKWGHFRTGGKVAKGNPLFPRIETEKA